MTDPPFDLSGSALGAILDRYRARHLVLITSMRQLLDLAAASDWQLAFDFVLDAVQPKSARSRHQPHYTHQTGVYLRRPGEPSRFDRYRRTRSDVFESKYWPTVIRAPRERAAQHGHAKSVAAWTDILGSFDVESVVDPFAGSFTTMIAAFEIGISATCIERDASRCAGAAKTMRFIGLDAKEA